MPLGFDGTSDEPPATEEAGASSERVGYDTAAGSFKIVIADAICRGISQPQHRCHRSSASHIVTSSKASWTYSLR